MKLLSMVTGLGKSKVKLQLTDVLQNLHQVQADLEQIAADRESDIKNRVEKIREIESENALLAEEAVKANRIAQRYASFLD